MTSGCSRKVVQRSEGPVHDDTGEHRGWFEGSRSGKDQGPETDGRDHLWPVTCSFAVLRRFSKRAERSCEIPLSRAEVGDHPERAVEKVVVADPQERHGLLEVRQGRFGILATQGPSHAVE